MRFKRLHEEAFAHLSEAEAIYRRCNDHRGRGTVHLNYGYLDLDNGDLDRAASQADEAYRLASKTSAPPKLRSRYQATAPLAPGLCKRFWVKLNRLTAHRRA